MSTTLTIRDEALGQPRLAEWALEVLTERLSVRELVRSRVWQEVQDYNQRRKGEFRGLVRPDAEVALNGGPSKAFRPIDWQQQFDRALAAFERNQIIILIDDRQTKLLDEEFAVGPRTIVTFL